MKHLTIAICLALSVPALCATAQEPASAESAALRQCLAAAAAGNPGEAVASGRTAEAGFERRLERDPRDVEALVDAARAKSQCLLPAANFIRQGELSTDAMNLLDRALEIQPDHWTARFALASIAFRSPSFLGRAKRAAKELDELLRQQGDRTDNPRFARVFAMRGLLLSRDGKADSARVLFARGAALFPEDEELKRLNAQSTPPPAPDAMTSTAASLATVQVTAAAAPRRAPLPSIKEVSRSQVLMAAGGAADVLQSVQMQPGATRVGEGGDVYTRGGDVSETSLIVDGGRILSLARFEGLNGSMFGAIEPFVVKSVRYSSGGFGARHGNALSGVLEIETDGRPRERSTRAGVSLVQASGTMRVPFTRTLGGWVSGRASHTGALLATHGRSDEFRGAPRSQEVIGSMVAAPTPFTEMRATAIVERDDSRRYVTAAGWRGTFDADGSLRAAMLSSRWMSASAPVVVRGSFAASSRSTDWAFGVLSRERNEGSAVTRLDSEWEPRSGLIVRAGAEQGTHTRAERGTVPTTASVAVGAPVRTLDASAASANQVGGYGELELTAGALSLTAGVRADRLPGETGRTIDPRLAVAARTGAWTTRLSGGIFHQGRWRGDVTIPDAGTPSGLAGRASHLVLGVERDGAAGFIRAEAFAKRYGSYRAYGGGPEIRKTDINGLDVIAQRISGPVTGWVGYSWLDARSHLADGQEVRGAFDITHTGTVSVTAALPSDWSVGSTARYGSGAPRTPIVGGRQLPDGRIDPIYGALMTDRLPAYARLDARVMRHLRLPGALLTTFVEVLNVTSRGNVSTYTWDPAYTSREPVHSFFAQRTVVAGGEFMFR